MVLQQTCYKQPREVRSKIFTRAEVNYTISEERQRATITVETTDPVNPLPLIMLCTFTDGMTGYALGSIFDGCRRDLWAFIGATVSLTVSAWCYCFSN